MWKPGSRLQRGHIEAARAENKSETPSAAAQAQAAPVSKWEVCVDRLLEQDGFVVVGSPEQFEKGSKVRLWGSNRPFRIIGGAEYEDALRQWRIYQEIRGDKIEAPAPPGANWHYYKYGIRT